MRLGKFRKTPAEIKRYSISYDHWLDEGEYISTISFSVSPTTSVLAVAPDAVGANVRQIGFFVSGGNDKQTYTVVATMTTTSGQRKQDSISFEVRDEPVGMAT